jgi:hypothetical protein
VKFSGSLKTYGSFSVNNVGIIYIYIYMLIPMAAQYKAWICGRSLAGIVGSNASEDIKLMSAPCEYYVLSGRNLCVGLIARLGESY